MTPLPVNARGPDRPAPAGRRAFTLIEVVLIIGLLGLLTFLLVGGASNLLRSREPRPDDVFWSAVTAARQLALESNRTVTLRYDEEKQQLTWAIGTSPGSTLAFPGRLLEFIPLTSAGLVLVGGQAVETGSLPFVRFYPDGGCDAFRVQLTDAAGQRLVLGIDQWTCAPILAAEPNK